MFNPINAIFSIISIPEPAITLDDTASFPPVSGYEDDSTLPEIGQYVLNTISGECGIVRGIWTNFANQTVVNVRVNGMMASWNVAEIAPTAYVPAGA